MNARVLLTSLISFISLQASAYEMSYIAPKALLPGEDVQQFELADLNGNGRPEIVFLNSNGELKYAVQGFEINQTTFSFLESKSWKIDSYPDAVLTFSGGRYYRLSVDGRTRASASILLTDGTYKSLYYSEFASRLLIDFVSENEISGKIKDPYLTGSGEINFVARPE